MKKIALLLLLFFVASCQMTEKTDIKQIKENLTYFKDERTGLCYAVVNSISTQGGSYTSITCVPCDSLKHVKVE